LYSSAMQYYSLLSDLKESKNVQCLMVVFFGNAHYSPALCVCSVVDN
jgi:hypothetical protein